VQRSLVILAVLAAGCIEPEEIVEDVSQIVEEDLGPGDPQCAFDESADYGSAVALTVGDEGRGFVCPVGDRDWFAFNAPAGTGVIRVSLKVDGQLSQIEPTYALWGAEGGTVGGIAASAPPEQLGSDIKAVHCLGPGSYALAVSDNNDDARDFRREYVLSVTTSEQPDGHEPNETAETATALDLGEETTAYLACHGDADWYVVDAYGGEALSVVLDAADTKVQARVRVRDADAVVVLDMVAPAGKLDKLVQLNGPGPHTVEVTDDDIRNADPDTPYTLTVNTVVDLDSNEPNPSAAQSTPLSDDTVRCGPKWTPWLTSKGTIGAPGDNDWFRLPIGGCERGIIEAQLSMPGAGGQVQPTLTVIRGEPGSKCTEDEDCAVLNVPCSTDYDCAGYFNTCLPQGKCAGAVACLPSGSCGGVLAQRHSETGTFISAPLAGGDQLYLRVSDFQSNDAAPGVEYTLKTRLIRDPDRIEPDNPYFVDLLSSIPTGKLKKKVTAVPVHDCTHDNLNKAEDCCGPDDWISGTIAYRNDIDWYRHKHPCPGEDCLVRIKYELDAGPVDFYMGVYLGDKVWTALFVPKEKGWNPTRRGSLGGFGPGNICHFAFRDHGAWYTLGIRDWQPGGATDADPMQRYRFCVEKVSDFCAAPCSVHPVNGECGP